VTGTRWPLIELGHLTKKIGSGATPTGGKGAYLSSGIPLIRSMNVYDLEFLDDDLAFIDEKQAKKLDNVITQSGDVLLNITGASVARCCILPERFAGGRVNQHVAILRADPSKLEGRYLTYVLVSPAYKGQLLSIAGAGATREALTKAGLERFAVPTPPLETQRRIAGILGAYDDLIEVNRRRVAVLEEMARGLFEEWFVRFRFPGHEQVPILATPYGPLPQGWVSQPVGETFEMLGGGTPSKTIEAYWEAGSVDWYTPTDLTGAKTMFMDRSATRITEAGLAKSSAKLFAADSIMMTSRATIGAIAINTGPACTNQGFITCLPNERVPRSYLFYWLHQNVPVFIGHATGATFKEITKGVFKRLPIVVPSSDLAGRFESQVRPMHDMILALERSNRALAASRDLLLPRLISGQLSVEAAERQLEDAA